MDTFPTCLPITSCELTTKENIEESNLSVEYKNLYSVDGNITAIDGSQVIYSCAHDFKNKTLIGDSVRFCQIDGKWTGEEPICIGIE
jgi:hypothetical protein